MAVNYAPRVVSYAPNIFKIQTTGVIFTKLFSSLLTTRQNKLECLDYAIF
jgi:hypothetical protein